MGELFLQGAEALEVKGPDGLESIEQLVNAVPAPGVVSSREQVEMPADLAVSSPVNRGGQEASLCLFEGAYGIVPGQEATEEPGF